MAKCLVTGGAGFIGSHLVEALLEEGHDITVFDNLSTGSKDNLQNVLAHIRFIEGDLTDTDTVMALCNDINTVFHLAASSSVTQSLQNPQISHNINVTGTLNLLDSARIAGVEQVVFASSAAVYGSEPTQPKQETFSPCPINPYGLSKYMGELYAELYSSLYSLNTTCLRFFNVYGPRQNPNSPYSGVITNFVHKLLAHQNPVIYGDGYQSRDFIHVSDIVRACMLAAFHNSRKGCLIYNVATGIERNLHDILEILSEHLQRPFEIEYLPDRRKDIRHSLGDITKIKVELGFEPTMDFQTGLVELYDYITSTSSVRALS